MALTRDDYLAQLSALLPPGPAWDAELEAFHEQLLGAHGLGLSAAHRRADDLLREYDLYQVSELLERWEAVLGLPDKCSGMLEATLQGRRNALLAKLASVGGQSINYFVGVARQLGFDTTVSEFHPFRAGRSTAGDPLTNGDWVYAWRVNAPETTVIQFRSGRSVAGEPLQVWGNDTLECKLNQLKPAQTILLTGYGVIEAEGIYMAADQLFFAANYTLPSNLESV